MLTIRYSSLNEAHPLSLYPSMLTTNSLQETMKQCSTPSRTQSAHVSRPLTSAAMGPRPDICAAVRSLPPFTATFGPDHINGAKHIMRYLTGCPGHGIMYTMGESKLVGYTDVDWANDHLNH